jgi:hypothetical protein
MWGNDWYTLSVISRELAIDTALPNTLPPVRLKGGKETHRDQRLYGACMMTLVSYGLRQVT